MSEVKEKSELLINTDHEGLESRLARGWAVNCTIQSKRVLIMLEALEKILDTNDFTNEDATLMKNIAKEALKLAEEVE